MTRTGKSVKDGLARVSKRVWSAILTCFSSGQETQARLESSSESSSTHPHLEKFDYSKNGDPKKEPSTQLLSLSPRKPSRLEPPLDVLTATCSDINELLQNGAITSVRLVELYLNQISKHNSKLNAMISIAPVQLLMERAAELDRERENGAIKSPLHGIPITIKVGK